MQEIEVHTWDDVLNSRGEKVASTRTEVLSFGGRSVELDLTDSTAKEIAEMLAYLFDIGRKPGKARKTTVAADVAQAPAKPRAERAYALGSRKAAIDYGKGMRAYADAMGINYTTDSGNVSFTKALKDEYAAYLATQE